MNIFGTLHSKSVVFYELLLTITNMEDKLDPKGMCCKIHNFKPVTHVIFDLDGTILNTEEIYEGAIADICEKYGKTYTNELKLKVAGTVEQDSARIVIEGMELPLTIDEFLKQFHDLSNAKLPTCPYMPGAEKAVRHLHKKKIPIAIATSSSKEGVELKFKNRQDVYQLFDHVVCGGTDPDVKRGKPHPDIFLVCAGRFPGNPPASKCLVFEDSVNGVKGALAAGMQVVMLPDNNVPYDEWKHATMRLDYLDDMSFGLFGLPPYPDIAAVPSVIPLSEELTTQDSIIMGFSS